MKSSKMKGLMFLIGKQINPKSNSCKHHPPPPQKKKKKKKKKPKKKNKQKTLEIGVSETWMPLPHVNSIGHRYVM